MTSLEIASISGLSITLAVQCLVRLWSTLPVEDRAYRDCPPVAFRLLWPLVRIVEVPIQALLPLPLRSGFEKRLEAAGLAFTLSGAQFVASLIMAAAVAAALVGGLSVLARGHVWLSGCVMAAAIAFALPVLWLRRRVYRRQNEIIHSLPNYLDIVTLSVEAGAHLITGLNHALDRAPESPLREELARVLRDVRAGKTRAEALREMAVRTHLPVVKRIVGSLLHAERSGSSVGSLLRAQAEQLRNERFQRAEKRAAEAPVRLLGPLLLCMFPTTFVVLCFLVFSKAMQAGLIDHPWLYWAYHWPAS